MADFVSDLWSVELLELEADSHPLVVWGVALAASVSSSLACGDFGPCFGELVRRSPIATEEIATDLSNPFVERDASSAGAPLGTYSVDAVGDLANESGRPYLRKRILRRCTTAEGGFFHLAGYGFLPGLKRTITPDLLRRIQAKAQTQIAREPDVRSVTVHASKVSSIVGGVRLDIRVADVYGSVEDVSTVVRLWT